jgi:DNA-binding NtrC family response regulator
MKRIRVIPEQIERWEGPILIGGVEGAGKELLAAAIHYNSTRRDKMFIIQNCSIFNNELLSAMLFGHEKDSLVSIIPDKRGLLDIADGGTLFLDEIDSMDVELQAKLLRVMKNGTFYKEGGPEKKKVNVKIIVAINENLKKQDEQSLFCKFIIQEFPFVGQDFPPERDVRYGRVALLLAM